MKDVTVSFGVVCLIVAVTSIHAYAQLPGGPSAVITVPGSVTQDQPVETNTLDLDQVQLPPIVTSVTTGGGAGLFTSDSGYLNNLSNQLFSGANAQNFADSFPGWVALPPDSTTKIAIPLSELVLRTYGNALAVAESQGGEVGTEDLAKIETANAHATAVLQAIQINTEAQLATIQQIQLLRLQVSALVTVEATKAAEEFNERARTEATNARRWNLGVSPGQ